MLPILKSDLARRFNAFCKTEGIVRKETRLVNFEIFGYCEWRKNVTTQVFRLKAVSLCAWTESRSPEPFRSPLFSRRIRRRLAHPCAFLQSKRLQSIYLSSYDESTEWQSRRVVSSQSLTSLQTRSRTHLHSLAQPGAFRYPLSQSRFVERLYRHGSLVRSPRSTDGLGSHG